VVNSRPDENQIIKVGAQLWACDDDCFGIDMLVLILL